MLGFALLNEALDGFVTEITAIRSERHLEEKKGTEDSPEITPTF
jgi:hypothetical protein